MVFRLLGAAAQPTAAIVAAAIPKINEIIEKKSMNKKVIEDVLKGFNILERALQSKEREAYETVLKWLRLYLTIHSTSDPRDASLRGYIEKSVPVVVSYIIGCLQHRAQHTPMYHYKVLEMLHELLSNVRAEVIEKLANFEPGIIACLWFPIDFVGDFNTQMMALRLLVMLLKHVDGERQRHELEKIRSSQTHLLKDKLAMAVKVINYPAGKFENLARELLNCYNMNMAQNILVYSFRCKTLHLDKKFEFYKALNVADFWVDLNYCPRTLTFNGRYKPVGRNRYLNCTVALRISHLKLISNKLYVQLCTPAEFSEELQTCNELSGVAQAQLLLPRDEALRLSENSFIFECYNKLQNQPSPQADAVSIEDEQITIEEEENANASDKENIQPSQNLTNHEQALPAKKQTPSTTNFASKNLRKSFDMLVGDFNNSAKQTPKQQTENNTSNQAEPGVNPPFKQPAKLRYKNALNDVQAKVIPKPLSLSQNCIIDGSIQPAESPKSSRESNSNNKNYLHPIRQLREKRRFFKTLPPSSDSEASTRVVPPKMRTRKRKSNLSGDLTMKRKQVNKVKPMSRSLEINLNAITTENAPIPAAIINVTNFLDSGNESAAVISDSQRRTILENVRRICPKPAASANDTVICGHVNVVPNFPQVDIYENRDVSDAEPGQSYRSFNVRRAPSSCADIGTKAKRSRKMATVKEDEQPSTSKAVKTAGGTSGGANASAVAKRTRKRTRSSVRRALEGIKPNADEKPIPSHNVPITLNHVTNLENQTLFSADIEIDSSLEKHDSTKQLQVGQTNESSVHNIHHESELDSVDMQPVFKTPISAPKVLPTLANGKVESVPSSEIEQCRHDITSNQCNDISPMLHINMPENAFNECKSPPAPNMMNISDIGDMSDDESMLKLPKPADNNNDNEKPKQLFTRGSNEQTPQCILYRRRSEYDSDSDCSEVEIAPPAPPSTKPQSAKLKNKFPTLLRKSTENCTSTITNYQITTKSVATSIVTRHERLFSQEVIVNVDVSPPAAKEQTTYENLQEPESSKRLLLSDSTLIASKLNEHSSTLTRLNRSNCQDMPCETPIGIKREFSNTLAAYRKSIHKELENIRADTVDTQNESFIKKVCDIGTRVVEEIDKERKELQALEQNLDRIVRQLDWQYETYKRKSEQFQCFKENIEGVMNVLAKIDIKKNVESQTRFTIDQLQNAAKSASARQWREFVNASTENLIKNISNLADL